MQNFAIFQKIQLDNLEDFENAAKRVFSCKDRRRYSRKRAKFCRTSAENLPRISMRDRDAALAYERLQEEAALLAALAEDEAAAAALRKAPPGEGQGVNVWQNRSRN